MRDIEGTTRILAAVREGRPEAANELLPVVYDELCELASRRLRRERIGHTLETGALAHEAYLRLIQQDDVEWQDRAHFLAVASVAIRRILIDHARGKHAAKRGGERQRVALDASLVSAEAQTLDLIALHEALDALAKIDDRKSRIVELRYFGGLQNDEVAEVLTVSRATIEREWSLARAWLHREMQRE